MQVLRFALFLCALAAANPAFSQLADTKSWTIYFPTDVHQLDAADSTTLAEVVDWMKNLKQFTLSIQGHTDSIGSWEYNKALSLRRANAAKQFLAANGLHVDTVEVVGWSFDKPSAGNNTESGRQDNRRTTITAHYQTLATQTNPVKPAPRSDGEAVATAHTPPTIAGRRAETKTDKNNEASITSFYNSSVQVKGQEGTTIYVPSSSIDNYSNGQTLHIHMLELVTSEAIIAAKASTYSDGQLLQSAGMAFFTITVDGLPAQLKDCIEVKIPAPKIDGMRPYLTPANGDLNRTNWKELPADQMRYDETAKAYIIKVCNRDQLSAMNGSFGVNVDKPIGDAGKEPILVKVKNRHGQQPIPSILYEDGTVTNLRPVVTEPGLSNTFKHQYYLYPNVADTALTVSDTYELPQNGTVFELNQVVMLKQDAKGNFKKSKVKTLNNKSRILVKCPKFKYKKAR